MARSQKQLIAALKKAMTRLGKVRDELREIQNEAQELADLSTVAFESLEYAVETLSEQV